MNFESLVLLVIACLAVNLSPGPSVLLVTSVTAARGFKAGFFAILGMSAGAFGYVVLAASGVAALLATSPVAFAIVQYLGAAYLIYLGIDLLKPRNAKPIAIDDREGIDHWQYFGRGLMVDLLNPKIAIFFLAFIPQFLNSVASPGFFASLTLGSVFLATGIIVNSVFAGLVAAGRAGTRGRLRNWVQRWIPGSVLVGLGLRLLWQES